MEDYLNNNKVEVEEDLLKDADDIKNYIKGETNDF